MSIKISYTSKIIKSSSANIVLFSKDKFSLSGLKKYLSNNEFSYVNDLLKNSDLKKNLLIFEVSSKKKIVLIQIKKNIKTSEIENLGGEFFGRVNYGKNTDYFIFSDSINNEKDNFFYTYNFFNIGDNFN